MKFLNHFLHFIAALKKEFLALENNKKALNIGDICH